MKYQDGESFINISKCTINSNRAHQGGVITTVTVTSIFTISNSIFSANDGGSQGGVIHALNSSFNILESTFINNAAHTGGVILSNNSSFIITSSILSITTLHQFTMVELLLCYSDPHLKLL